MPHDDGVINCTMLQHDFVSHESNWAVGDPTEQAAEPTLPSPLRRSEFCCWSEKALDAAGLRDLALLPAGLATCGG
jgi:hypothetical protein